MYVRTFSNFRQINVKTILHYRLSNSPENFIYKLNSSLPRVPSPSITLTDIQTLYIVCYWFLLRNSNNFRTHMYFALKFTITSSGEIRWTNSVNMLQNNATITCISVDSCCMLYLLIIAQNKRHSTFVLLWFYDTWNIEHIGRYLFESVWALLLLNFCLFAIHFHHWLHPHKWYQHTWPL